MNSIRINLEKEIEDLFNNLIIKGNIELNKLNYEKYSKGIIRIIYEFISIYINLSTYKRHYIWRNINYLNHKFYILRKSLISIVGVHYQELA